MTKKIKKRFSYIFKLIIIILLIFVASNYVYKNYKDYNKEIEDAKTVAKIKDLLDTNIDIYEENIPEDSNESITRLEVNSKDLLVSNVSYIGVIELPTLGIKKPIIPGITKKDIASKVGWETHSAMPGNGGNVALAAHNDVNYFGLISNLNNNNNIVITTKDGIFTYKVFDKFKVHKTEIWVYDTLPNYEETVTLITCVYPDSNYRWIVRGELINKENL